MARRDLLQIHEAMHEAIINNPEGIAYGVIDYCRVHSPYNSASSLKRPLEVVTFLHRLYLPKLVHVARFYFHAHSTTRLNQNLCKRVLTALSQCQLILSGHFLVTSQALSFQSWRFVARSKQMTSVFWESLADQICRWANQISRVESCFLRETVMQLWRWAAQQKSYVVLCSHHQKY